jgi:hypothetical protein
MQGCEAMKTSYSAIFLSILYVYFISHVDNDQILKIWTNGDCDTDADDSTSKESVSFRVKKKHRRYFILESSFPFEMFPRIDTEMQLKSKFEYKNIYLLWY